MALIPPHILRIADGVRGIGKLLNVAILSSGMLCLCHNMAHSLCIHNSSAHVGSVFIPKYQKINTEATRNAHFSLRRIPRPCCTILQDVQIFPFSASVRSHAQPCSCTPSFFEQAFRSCIFHQHERAPPSKSGLARTLLRAPNIPIVPIKAFSLGNGLIARIRCLGIHA